jgi:hypothetical protein
VIMHYTTYSEFFVRNYDKFINIWFRNLFLVTIEVIKICNK